MRLAWWCIAFVAGDACALADAIGWRSGAALALCAAAVVGLARGRRVRVAVPIAFFVAGALLGTRAARPVAAHPALAAAFERDDAQEIEGIVARGPESTGTGARLIVALSRIAGTPASGTLALAVVNGWPDFGPGERITCRARLRELRGTRNPGLPDPALALRAAGIDALAGVPDAGAITRLAEPGARGPRRIAFLARRALRAAIDRELTGDAAAFLKTAVLGDRRGIGPAVEEGFRVAGATHVLSVSGLHLAAVATLLFFIVRSAASRVPRLPLYVYPSAVAAAVALPAIALFALVTGEAIATLRSALMLSIGMGAYLVGRRASAAPAIAAAALVLLASSPLELADPSLQLSVASVVGIALGARGLGPRGADADAGRVRRAFNWLWRFVAATIAATAATAPLVAHHFGEVAPLSPLGNLALVPIVELAVVPIGLAGAAAGAVWAPLGKLPLAAAGLAARAALAVADVFRAHGPLWLCRTPNLLETAALTAAGCLALVAAGRARRARYLLACAAIGAVLVAVGSLALRERARRHARDLTVTFLDIGQGDAAVVEAPGPAVMLIDGGGVRDGSFDPGARIVEPFLRARGIDRVDVVALSHPHPDHLNGLFRIVERFPVGAFWSGGNDGHNPEYQRFVALARQRGVPIPDVVSVGLGGATVVPLGPFESGPDGAGERIAAPAGLSVNDASLVLRVGFAGRGILFAGDLEADGEGELAGRRDVGQVVAADVLKVPHHGSRTSSTPELVDAVAPGLAVISLGWRNQFHFPAPEVVARYTGRGTRVLRTDRDGAITVVISPEGRLTVRCERGCRDIPPQPNDAAGR